MSLSIRQSALSRVKNAIIYGSMTVLAMAYPLSATIDFANAVSDAPSTAKPAPTYTYDEATGHWNTETWQYDPVSGTYIAVVTEAANPPVVADAPSASVETPVSDTTATTDSASNLSAKTPVVDTPVVSDTTKTTDNTKADTSATINNTTNSTAASGDATVSRNTAAGGATTGSAIATDTVINSINSSTGGDGVVSFVSNVSGDVTGDVQLYPMILGAMLSSGAISPATTAKTTGSTVVNNNDQITNNINLAATSGDATVSGNTSAGSATTGSADTVANVMNIINSMISANKSFIGTINIYGNLNGDILLAPDFIPQLIASNKNLSSTSIDINNTASINNNISLSALSGAASVSGNTSAGNATTGSANTNLVLLNLSGHEVVASNSLLVFVNVLGKWVGVIVDAPVGATAAVIGNSVTQNDVTTVPVTVNNNSTITNNIVLNSQTGNASVTKNTQAGSATSGNATASANILNMNQSIFGLTGWFGALFINVFGSWNGSFGINTTAGTVVSPPTIGTPGSLPVVGGTSQTPQAIRFINRPAVLSAVASPVVTKSSQPVSGEQAVLGAQTGPSIKLAQKDPIVEADSLRLAVTAAMSVAMVLSGVAILRRLAMATRGA